ncbi:MAG: GNAT family N-acetyltransferase [Candidatus Rokubacteria bacterium]|nr:GNAT family N-acetyltransferase [Candidatus Rokubacteria bacterium]
MTHVERIEDAAAFEKLRGEWTALLSTCTSDCLFLTWEWLFTWWKHLAEDRRLSILVVRSRGELIAIAPLAWRPRRLSHLLSVRSLEFLGTGSVGSDYLDLITRRGLAVEAARALAAHLVDGTAVMGLAQLEPGAPNAWRLAAELERRGWSVRSAGTSVCPFIDLAGGSWESYLDGLGPAHRYNFRRRLRQLSRLGELRLERVETEAQRRAAVRALVTLHHMRWYPRGGSSALHSTSLVAFHDEFSGLALERGWLRLFTLRLDGRPVASVYGFRYRDRFYFYQSGFDPSYARQSSGLVALGLSIKAAVEEGVKEYDLLHGDEEYKFHWAHRTRALQRLELYPPRVRGWLYRQAIEASRAARHVARRVLLETVSPGFAAGRRNEPYAVDHATGAP